MNKNLPPLLLGKRALAVACPEKLREEKLARTLGPAPTAVATIPLQGTLGRASPGAEPAFVRCSGVSPMGVEGLARALHLSPRPLATEIRVFGTGDPFVVLPGDVARRRTVVAQALASDHSTFDVPTQIVEALQAVCAARAAGADEHIALLLPAALDPDVHPSPLNHLVARLAKASGAREVHYRNDVAGSALDVADPGTSASDVRRAFDLRLAQARTSHSALQLAREALKKKKQVGRRGLVDQERAWRGLEVASARRAAALPARESDPGPQVVFSVRASHALGASIREALGAEEGRHVRRPEATGVELETDVEGKDVVIVVGTREAPERSAAAHAESAASMTFEGLLLADAVHQRGAARVSVVQAYQMNGRTDRAEHDPTTQAHSGAYAQLVAEWFKAIGCDDVVLVESHDVHTESLWSDPSGPQARQVGGMEILARHALAGLSPDARREAILALPDAGAEKRARTLKRAFGRMIVGEKTRSNHDSGAQLVKFGDGSPIPGEAPVFLLDDEVSGGGTLAMTARALEGQGAKNVHALVVHNNLPVDFAERWMAIARLRASGLKRLTFLDTQPLGPRISGLSDLLALGVDDAEVRAYFQARGVDRPLSELFDHIGDFVEIVSVAPAVASQLRRGGPFKAAIDQGESSTKMLIVDAAGRTVVQRAVKTYLGEGARGALTEGGERRAQETLRAFVDEASAWGIQARDIPVVATAAVRNSECGDAFTERLRCELGFSDIRVLSGVEEAELGYRGAVAGRGDLAEKYLTIDLGGGSFQMAIGTGDNCERAASTQVGTRAIKARFFDRPTVSAEAFARADAWLERNAPMPLARGVVPGRKVLYSGRAARFLAAHLGTNILSREALSCLRDALGSATPAERAEIIRRDKSPQVLRSLSLETHEAATDFALTGYLTLCLHTMRGLGIDSLEVTPTDALHALLRPEASVLRARTTNASAEAGTAVEQAIGTPRTVSDLQRAAEAVRARVVEYPDFPRPGILFQDMNGALADGPTFAALVGALAGRYAGKADVFAGLEARGLPIAAALAARLGTGTLLLRKPKKLPGQTLSKSYALEYGKDSIEMQRGVLPPGARVVVVDDLLATGGTMRAACDLIREDGGKVVEALAVIELSELKGRKALEGTPFFSLLQL